LPLFNKSTRSGAKASKRMNKMRRALARRLRRAKERNNCRFLTNQHAPAQKQVKG